jgi:hypothetical protein
VNSLYASEKKKSQQNNEMYKRFLAVCHTRIQARHSLGYRSMTYMVPPFVVGQVLYDHAPAVSYVKRKLRSGGFRVKQIEFMLHIDWIRNAREKEKRKDVNCNEIIKYKQHRGGKI